MQIVLNTLQTHRGDQAACHRNGKYKLTCQVGPRGRHPRWGPRQAGAEGLRWGRRLVWASLWARGAGRSPLSILNASIHRLRSPRVSVLQPGPGWHFLVFLHSSVRPDSSFLGRSRARTQGGPVPPVSRWLSPCSPAPQPAGRGRRGCRTRVLACTGAAGVMPSALPIAPLDPEGDPAGSERRDSEDLQRLPCKTPRTPRVAGQRICEIFQHGAVWWLHCDF